MSRLILPGAVFVTMHVYCIRKDGTQKMRLEIDGGAELPGAFDLQERALLRELPEPKQWRLMTAGEAVAYRADLAAEDAEHEAQADTLRAKASTTAIERLAVSRMLRDALEENVKLRSDLAQARAAAIDEAAKVAERTDLDLPEGAKIYPDNGAEIAAAIRALASRPVSEREGAATPQSPNLAMRELVNAAAFFRKAEKATLDEKIAAGSDPVDWLIKAALAVAAQEILVSTAPKES